MKNLTKFLLIIALGAIGFQANAQTFRIKAGLNSAYKVQGTDVFRAYGNSHLMFGINLGGTAEFEINNRYSIETGLMLNHRGWKEVWTDTITRISYLDIPINFKYGFTLGKNKLKLSAGPYIGYGIKAGNLWKDQNNESNMDKIWGKDGSDILKHFDCGINLGTEYELGKFGIGFQYGIGLVNIYHSKSLYGSQKNRMLSLSLAYKFAEK
jgi:hypothetical protein